MVKRDYPRRPETRVWRAEAPTAEPVAPVRDPALRELLTILYRSRVAEAKALARYLDLDQDEALTA
jgi:hypothetical protein